MSTGVCGIMHTNLQNINEVTEYAFNFEKVANKLRIGTKQGGNISRYVYDKLINTSNSGDIIYELVDSPLDIHADDLFALGSYENIEPLPDRMDRVQQLFEILLKLEDVAYISLYTNYLFTDGDEEEVCIRAADFCKTMIKMYQQKEAFLPALRFKIIK
jgi:hypothetical protein